MADLFDIVDIVFKTVDSAGTGLPVYKHRAETGIKAEHIVINTTGVTAKPYVNKAPVVNVNLFTHTHPNGMINASHVRAIAGRIRAAIHTILAPHGMYFNARVTFEADLGTEEAEGFDLYNIRVEVITEK